MSNYIDVDEITKDVETLSKAFTINVHMPSGGKSVACNIKPTSEQDIAIKYCHDHNLLMIPVDLYHTLNVTYNAYMNNMTYEEAEKLLLEEVKLNE